MKSVWGILLLSSLCANAATTRWSCSTLNFLRGNLDNASTKDVVYKLDNSVAKKIIVLSKNSNVKIQLGQYSNQIELTVTDSITDEHMGTASSTVDSRSLTLYPMSHGGTDKGFSWVNCQNLDFGAKPN